MKYTTEFFIRKKDAKMRPYSLFLVETQRLALWSYTLHKSFLHTYPSVGFSGSLG